MWGSQANLCRTGSLELRLSYHQQDTDSFLYRDPYLYLKRPPLSNIRCDAC